MTPEQIRAIAKQAGGSTTQYEVGGEDFYAFTSESMTEFVRLVRESALDEAEQVCITTADSRATPYSDGYNMGAIDCTKAIRKLK